MTPTSPTLRTGKSKFRGQRLNMRPTYTEKEGRGR
jgi:hypothetical protein